MPLRNNFALHLSYEEVSHLVRLWWSVHVGNIVRNGKCYHCMGDESVCVWLWWC